MVTYDEKTGSLYSSDIFAAFDREWKLYADESYIELARSFIKSYVWGREPLKYAYDKFKKLKIDYIFPQHGGIIKENVDKFLNILKDTIPGQLLEELKNKPSFEQEQKLFETGKNWLEGWLNNKINAYTLDDLLKISIKQGPSTVAILIDNLIVKSKELGIANPLTYGHLHKWKNLNTSYTEQLISSIRKRFLSRLYGMSYCKDTFYEVIKEGLLSFKTDLNIMFVDIRGFTKWSKDKTPGEIVGILNKQIESISKIIHSNGGFVNKIIGDGILAYFPENKSSLCNLTSIEKIIVKIKPEDPETAGFKFKPDLNIMEIK
ncbi:MAG: hypothetical protein HY934_01565, partial [Candidatus Firestonebacteria bacterium]|nr:hypothetical protein [Candidatus Firestonebacteria bacterium]